MFDSQWMSARDRNVSGAAYAFGWADPQARGYSASVGIIQ